MRRKSKYIFSMSLDEIDTVLKRPVQAKEKPCVNCGKLCGNHIRGELNSPYCSDDCMKQAGDTEPIT